MNTPHPLVRRLAARLSLLATRLGLASAARHRRRRELWQALHRPGRTA